MRHRVRASVVALAVAVSGAVSCAGSHDDAATPTDTTSTDTTSTDAATPADTTSTDAATPADTAASDAANPAGTAVSGDPSATGAPTTDSTGSGNQPEGFGTVAVRITEADGSVCEVCMWLADSGDERSRGLMGVTDLGPAAGMVFAFDAPTDGAFYMFRTPTPLSIAWFAPDGAFVSATDMAPCAPDAPAADCERFRATGTYQLAIEVFAGGLDELGIGPGSRAELVAGTEAPDCPPTSASG